MFLFKIVLNIMGYQILLRANFFFNIKHYNKNNLFLLTSIKIIVTKLCIIKQINLQILLYHKRLLIIW